MCKPNPLRRRLLAISITLSLVSLAGCGGDGDDDDRRLPIQMPPAETDLTWDRGNWDELDWQ